jgi:hypothetical protein
MVFEIVSTQSWNVLGTFDDEAVAREAVRVSVAERGAGLDDLVVYISDDAGAPRDELGADVLAVWAGIDSAQALPA